MKQTHPMMHIGPNRVHHRDYVSFLSENIDPQQALELLKANRNGCSRHKPDYRGMREKIDQESQSDQAKQIHNH